MRGVYVLLLISLFGYAGRVGGQESVTITQCYEWARANYPQIHQMGLIDQTERYSLSNVGKAWLPQLSVSGKASYQSDVTKLPLDGDKISSLLPGFEIPSLSKDQYQVVAQVDQTIWDGGSTRSARALTRAEAIANREQLESELYALNDRVNQIYFGCLLQDELIRQNALLQKELQVNIERIKAMMDNGVANQSDLESMEVELLNARQNEIELKASRTAYRQMLATTDKLTENLIYEKELIEIPRDHDKLKILYYIEVQQNRIRKEAYEYFKNIQRNIEQTGSIFSPIPTEVRGNIVCVSDPKEWVLGYVDVTSTTIMKRFMPELRDFYETSYDCAKNILTGMAPDGYTYYIYSGAPTVPNRYAPFRCVDCTYDGRGTKNKPSWWPTDHL